MLKRQQKKFLKAYDEFAPQIYRYIYLKVRSRQTAEDLSSEVFLKCLNYARQGKTIDNYRAFLYQISRNVIIDFFRKDSKISSVPIEGAKELDSAVAFDKSVIQNIEIENALKRLKQDYQDVIILYYVDDLSIKEICNILDKKESAVRVLIHRAITALKNLIE